jgi:subtilisin-like proprotein convertase family protein
VLAALTLGLTAGTVAPASAATYTGSYSNTGAITILDNASADPYPSTIAVPSGGAVTSIGDVSVTLNGLTHSYVGDLDVVVVSPDGTPVYLLCGQQLGGKDDVSNIDVTFSSDGVGATECADPGDPSDLDDLELENPAGEWDLYVDDYADGDAGQIARGWSVSFNQAAAPTVTSEPQDVYVTAGQYPTFTAHASGAPKPSVLWQSSTDGGTTWDDYAGENNDTFYPSPVLSDDGRLVRAAFTNKSGTTYSRAATMHVFAGPSAPRDVTASQTDEQTTRVSWSVPATGEGGISGYRVTAVSGSSSVEQNVSYMQKRVDLPLAPNATYTISVFARNGSTEGPAATTTLATRRWPTMSVSKTSAVAGDALVIKGTGLPNETLTIQKWVLGSSASKDLVSVTADATGAFQVTTKVDRSSTYQVVTSTGLLSPYATVRVAWKTSMAAKRVSARTYKFYGTLAPATANVPVKISYKKPSGGYALLGTVRTGPSGGRWAFTKKFSASKTMVFKASIAATTSNTAGSKLLTVKVR